VLSFAQTDPMMQRRSLGDFAIYRDTKGGRGLYLISPLGHQKLGRETVIGS